MPNDEELLNRLRKMFLTEAQEHIRTIALGLVELEQEKTAAKQPDILDTIFRSAHSLKGAARSVNAADIEALCQAVEGVFAALRDGKLDSSQSLFDLLHDVINALPVLLEFIDAAPADLKKPAVAEMLRSLENALTSKPIPAVAADRKPATREVAATGKEPEASPASVDKSAFSEPASADESTLSEPASANQRAASLRIDAARLDAVLLRTEELLSIKQLESLQATRLRQFKTYSAAWKKQWLRIRPDIRMIEGLLEGEGDAKNGLPAALQLTRVLEFLNWNRSFTESFAIELDDLVGLGKREQRSIAAKIDGLQDDITQIAIQPFSSLLDVLPLFVREVSHKQGKEVELNTHGGEVEIDRRILEEMKDPLIHLVRNCLDHGLETPAERLKKGKPAAGKLDISVQAQDGNHVEILLADDGKGIDINRLRDVAVRSALVAEEFARTLDDSQILPFIFQSGVSTSQMITDMSGRGLGLAIVKEKIEKMSGSIAVEFEADKGTCFRITLPLTFARFRGIIVRAGESRFVIPANHTQRVISIDKEAIQKVENRETIYLDGETLPVARLNEVLGISGATTPDETPTLLYATILLSDNQRIAIIVDEICDEMEVLTKSFGKQLLHVRNLAGATILGSGELIPVLNVHDLINTAIELGDSSSARPAIEAVKKTSKISLLVAEDSVTTRSLLKNILETADYRVEAAVDGIDAYTRLKNGNFDLLISDVDMPRLNGFGLTAKIREDRKLSELPVILVTSLDSQKDREHGMSVGANAYLVKKSFDQTNLLETIRRLI
jgi:two-component system chemotaxis sensor kinase CheA